MVDTGSYCRLYVVVTVILDVVDNNTERTQSSHVAIVGAKWKGYYKRPAILDMPTLGVVWLQFRSVEAAQRNLRGVYGNIKTTNDAP